MTPIDAKNGIEQLLAIMEKLRSPQGGCPWDQQQTFQSIAPYTLEEAYEVAHAIEQGDMRELGEELGDLLFQVVFLAQIASEQQLFDFSHVVQAICEKMIRRHPHVFGPDAGMLSSEQIRLAWEEIKSSERAAKGTVQDTSVLSGITPALPAITRAVKLQRRAASIGFDWTDNRQVIDKIVEELEEVRAEIGVGPQERLEEEIGDLLFACTNLARHLDVDPEQALRVANLKFEQRFRHMEGQVCAQGKTLSDCSTETMEALWDQAKNDLKRRD